jgi:acetylornithine deacetylase/succinyl-diaminopimelate desuccinylase-like protein
MWFTVNLSEPDAVFSGCGLVFHLHPVRQRPTLRLAVSSTLILCVAALSLCVSYLPAVAFYGHYDIQPAEEPDWRTNPFEMTAVDGYLCGRGTSDNKGPMLAFIYAVKVWGHTALTRPASVLCH